MGLVFPALETTSIPFQDDIAKTVYDSAKKDGSEKESAQVSSKRLPSRLHKRDTSSISLSFTSSANIASFSFLLLPEPLHLPLPMDAANYPSALVVGAENEVRGSSL